MNVTPDILSGRVVVYKNRIRNIFGNLASLPKSSMGRGRYRLVAVGVVILVVGSKMTFL